MKQAKNEMTFPVAAVSALQRGNKIEAIKLVREQWGIGLKEAKDAVEAYVEAQPGLQASLAAAQGESGRKALLWFACLIGAGILVYLLLFRR